MKVCLFCHISQNRIIEENEHAFAIYDKYPVTKFHALVIPKRHFEEYFGLTHEELFGCDMLLRLLQKKIVSQDNTIKGFNIGTNSGEIAGQTIFHCHIHLIPRRIGDVQNPRGGVRHIIPGKGNYEEKTYHTYLL